MTFDVENSVKTSFQRSVPIDVHMDFTVIIKITHIMISKKKKEYRIRKIRKEERNLVRKDSASKLHFLGGNSVLEFLKID